MACRCVPRAARAPARPVVGSPCNARRSLRPVWGSRRSRGRTPFAQAPAARRNTCRSKSGPVRRSSFETLKSSSRLRATDYPTGAKSGQVPYRRFSGESRPFAYSVVVAARCSSGLASIRLRKVCRLDRSGKRRKTFPARRSQRRPLANIAPFCTDSADYGRRRVDWIDGDTVCAGEAVRSGTSSPTSNAGWNDLRPAPTHTFAHDANRTERPAPRRAATGKEKSRMKLHLSWIRVTAAAAMIASVQPAAAQYGQFAPYQPQPNAAYPATPQPTAPQAPLPQQPVYTASRPQYQATGAYSPSAMPAYPTTPVAQYPQATATYPQYPQTAAQGYSQNMGGYSYVAQQPTPAGQPNQTSLPMPAPRQMNTSAARPNDGSNSNMPANMNTSAAQPGGMNQAGQGGQGGCGCNGVAAYGAGDFYNAAGCGCTTGSGYPSECGISNYFGDSGCNENQWFGGIYFLEMGRTNTTPQRLTIEVPSGSTYPYYPQANDTIMTTRDANFDFREGLEVRL